MKLNYSKYVNTLILLTILFILILPFYFGESDKNILIVPHKISDYINIEIIKYYQLHKKYPINIDFINLENISRANILYTDKRNYISNTYYNYDYILKNKIEIFRCIDQNSYNILLSSKLRENIVAYGNCNTDEIYNYINKLR